MLSIFLTLVSVLINELISHAFLMTNMCVCVCVCKFWCLGFLVSSQKLGEGGEGELYTRIERGVKLLDTGRNTLKFKCHVTSAPLSMLPNVMRICQTNKKYLGI